jgi:probable HAF family extracellular repeat protein
MRNLNIGLVLFMTLTTGASMMSQTGEARRQSLAHQYTITQLAPIRADDLKTAAYAINSNNEVVGTTQDSSWNGASAILWDAQGTAQYILDQPDSCSFPFASAINDKGQVTGGVSLGCQPYSTSPYFWDRKLGVKYFHLLKGANASPPSAINSSQRVVGQAWGDFNLPYPHAYLWTPQSQSVDLGTLPGGRTSNAVGINNSGHIAGTSDDSLGAVHNVLWTTQGAIQDLGINFGSSHVSCITNAINNRGQLAGMCSDTTPQGAAFVWSASVGLRDLSLPTGDVGATAVAINNLGQAIGKAWDSSSKVTAVLWDADGSVQRADDVLPPNSGWSDITLTGINLSGRIVGFGTYGGATRAFVMIPVK